MMALGFVLSLQKRGIHQVDKDTIELSRRLSEALIWYEFIKVILSERGDLSKVHGMLRSAGFGTEHAFLHIPHIGRPPRLDVSVFLILFRSVFEDAHPDNAKIGFWSAPAGNDCGPDRHLNRFEKLAFEFLKGYDPSAEMWSRKISQNVFHLYRERSAA